MEGYGTSIILPHLNIEAPMYLDEEGHHYSPAIFYSRLLGLNHSYEMQIVQHIMLHYQMRAFTVQRRGHAWREWAFPYPIALAMWLGNVHKRIKHTEWVEPLEQFEKWGMEVMVEAQHSMEKRFLGTRKQMIEVATAIAEIETHMEHTRQLEGRISAAQRVHLWTVDARWQEYRTRAGAFMSKWMAANDGKIGVIEPTYTDEGEIREEEPRFFTFLAAITQEDYNAFSGFVQELKRIMPDIRALFDDLR